MLIHQLESDLYQREGKYVNNFETTLPKPQSDLAKETLKDINKPIGVSEYITTRDLPGELKSVLPTTEEIEFELSG